MNTKAMIKPMQTALSKGDLKAVRLLVDQGFPLNELLFDGNDRTALQKAVDLGHHKSIEVLLSAGSNPDIKNDQSQQTALHQACEEGDLVAVKLLLAANAKTNVQDEHGISPLMLAAEAPKKATEIVEVLLAAGASVNPNKSGRNPLHSKMTDPGVVDQLVHAGADVNGSFHGITPLMKSTENFFLNKVDPSTRSFDKPQPKVVAALIAAGADPSARFPREMRFGADAKGQTIIDYARLAKLPAALLMILDSGKGSRQTTITSATSTTKARKKR